MANLTKVCTEGLLIAKRMSYYDNIRPEDREDFVQDALVEMMERAQQNGEELSTKDMWRTARRVRGRYRRGYARGKKACSLNTPIPGTDDIELWQTLPAKGNDLDSWLDAKDRLGQLPPLVVIIAKKLARGDPLTRNQRDYLANFRHDGKPNRERVRQLKRYHDLASRGLCVSCGKPAAEGFVRCPSCLERFRQYQKRYKQKKGARWQSFLRKYWRRKGLCWRCGRPPQNGYKLCEHCRQKNKEYLKRWKQKEKRRQELIAAAQEALKYYDKETIKSIIETI